MYLRYLDLLSSVEDKSFFLFRPFFRSKDVCKLIYKNKKLSYTAARSNIVSLLKTVVGEHVNIGIHSLRAGGATVAANSNVEERCLKRYGRWKRCQRWLYCRFIGKTLYGFKITGVVRIFLRSRFHPLLCIF